MAPGLNGEELTDQSPGEGSSDTALMRKIRKTMARQEWTASKARFSGRKDGCNSEDL